MTVSAEAGTEQAGRGARSAGLDLARSLAIGMVFFSHVVTYGGELPGPVMNGFSYMGHAGVELFFSLSGFLIGGILIRTSRAGLGPRALGRFWLRRWMRTLPLYWIVTFYLAYGTGADLTHSYLLVQSFYPKEPRVLLVAWSLVMEEYFYLFFPVIMLGLGWAGLRGLRSVAWTAGGLIVTCVAVRYAAVLGRLDFPNAGLHDNPFLRLDCAAFGVLAACAAAGWPGVMRVAAAHRGVIAWSCFGVALVGWGGLFVWMLAVPGETLLRAGFASWSPSYAVLQETVLDLAFAGAVLALAAGPLRWPGWAIWAVRQVSLLSYSIYLVHLTVLTTLDGRVPTGLSGLRIGATTLVTLAVATVTYNAIERPFLLLRDLLAPDGRRPRFWLGAGTVKP